MVIGYNMSSSTTYVRAYGRSLVGGVLSAPLFMASGCDCIESRGRWGDYNGIAVDPADESKVWFEAEVLEADNAWGTRIGQLFITPNPI